jgi:hypothetical protein
LTQFVGGCHCRSPTCSRLPWRPRVPVSDRDSERTGRMEGWKLEGHFFARSARKIFLAFLTSTLPVCSPRQASPAGQRVA